MINKIVWLRKYVIILIIGMMLLGCGNSGGTLVITNIPSRFNGKFVVAEGYGRSIDILGAQSINWDTGEGIGSRVSNGRVSVPMWIEDRNEYVRYAGNNTLELEVIFLNSQSTNEWDEIAWLEYNSVTFSNGNVTISFQDADYLYED